MNVISDVTHQWSDSWLSGHWTMQDDPRRVLNVFKCINSISYKHGLYMILVTPYVWGKHGERRFIIEEYENLDPLTAQCVVYEMLEKYGDASVRNEVQAVDVSRVLGPLSPSNQD